MQGEMGRDATPEQVITWIEALAAALGCTSGRQVMELHVRDGRYDRAFFRHGPVGERELLERAREHTA